MMAFGAPVLAAASLVSGLIGSGISAYGAAMQGQAQANAARFQAQVASNNAALMERNAEQARIKGQNDAFNQDLANRARMGKIAAVQAASGLDINSGSPLDIRASAAMLGRTDTETAKYNEDIKANQYEQQASNFRDEAKLKGMAASSASSAGMIGALSSVVSGASGLSDKWLTYQHNGAFNSLTV